jgi:predicted metal-dependent phosphoesterase TrpH
MHTHSEYSPDSRTPIAVQALAIKAAGLDVVAATDHNTIDGALRLREKADGFRVIVGEEISSRDGEIIGLFLEKAIPRDLSAEDTIARIHDQGGLVSVPHPYSHNRIYRIRREVLEREAIANDNRRALAFSVLHGIPGAVGSDAHRPWEIGRAYIEIPDFTGPVDFIDSLKSGSVTGRLAGHAIHFYTRYDKWRKWWSRRGSRTT